MKNLAYLSVIIPAILFTSCTVAIDRHGFIHEKDFTVTVENDGVEAELLSIEHDRSLFGEVFRMSMPFFSLDAGCDSWTGEKYVEVNIFK